MSDQENEPQSTDENNDPQATEANSNPAFSQKEKTIAFRKLSIILDELNRIASTPGIIAELRAQFKHRNFTGDNPFRVAIVKIHYDRLLTPKVGNSSRKGSAIKMASNQNMKEAKYWVEPTCSGKYKSGYRNEEIADELKPLRETKKLAFVQSSTKNPLRHVRSKKN